MPRSGGKPRHGARANTLQQEIAALQHELRRVQDGLERGRSPELERRAQRLRANIALCERELEAEISARSGGG